MHSEAPGDGVRRRALLFRHHNLTPSHQRLFIGELFAALKSKASKSDLIELLDAWQATAELDNDPEARERIERNRHSLTRASADEWMKQRATQ